MIKFLWEHDTIQDLDGNIYPDFCGIIFWSYYLN